MRLMPIFLLAAALPTFAADEWVRLTTPNFELYTNAGEKKGREAVLYFEQVRSFFTEISPSKKASSFPVRIIAFKSEKQFRPYSPSEAAAAFYTGSQNRDYIVMEDLASEHFPVAIHEYMHLIVRHSGMVLPLWLNEGWADVYSTLKPVGKKAMIGEMIPGRVQTLMTEKWLDFNTLTSVTEKSPNYNEKNRAGVFYSESWALTHMLYLTPRYKDNFPKLLVALSQGKSAAEACQIAYGKSSAEVYQDLTTYLRGRLYAGIVAVKLEKSEEEAELSPVSEFDSGVMLADLLAATGKRDQARAEYERLEKQSPQDVGIPQSLGYLAWQSGDPKAAREYFEKAFAAGNKDAQMCFHLAMLEREANAPVDKVTGPLIRALASKPDYLDARMELGIAHLNAKNYAGALAAFSQVRSVPAERASALFSARAYAYLGSGDFAEARKQAEDARKFAKSPTDSEQVDQLMRYLDARDEAEKRRKEYEARTGTSVAGPETPATVIPATGTTRSPGFGEKNPFVAANEKVVRVEGVAKSLDCMNNGAKFKVQVGDRLMAFDMTDPSKVLLKHAGAATFDFICGPQKPFHVTVEYVPGQGQDGAGVLKQLEF